MAVAPPPVPRIGPGTVIYIDSDQDYQFGTGPLAFHVTELEVAARLLHQREWIRIKGHRLGHDGRLDTRELEFRVRTSALPGAVKPPGFVPPPFRGRLP